MKHLLAHDGSDGTATRRQAPVEVIAFRGVELVWNGLTSEVGFWVFSVGLLAYVLIGGIYLSAWSDVDYWEHLAAIGALARNPLHPANPYVAGPESTHLFTPFHLWWGLVVAAIRTPAVAIAPLIAAVNVVLFLVGLRLMAATLVGRTSWAVPLGLSMLLLWLMPPWWSGFHNLGLLPLTGSYPYWCALSLVMIVLGPWSAGGGRSSLILTGALVTLVFLVHPLSGSFLALALIVRTLTERSRPLGSRVLRLLPVAVGLGLSLAWPFFPVAKAITAVPSYAQQGLAGGWQEFYHWFPVRLLPASLGLLYFVPAFRRRSADWLGWTLGLCVVTYLFNGLTVRSAFLGRYLIYIALLLQWGVLRWLDEARRSSPTRHGIATALFLLAIACTAVLEVRAALRWSPLPWTHVAHTPAGDRDNRDYVHRFERFAPLVSSGDIVMAGMEESWILPAVLGCKVVGVIHGTPYMRDYQARQLAVRRFFDPAASADERMTILERYRVSRVVIPHDEVSRLSGLDRRTLLIFRDDYYDVRSVRPATVSAVEHTW